MSLAPLLQRVARRSRSTPRRRSRAFALGLVQFAAPKGTAAAIATTRLALGVALMVGGEPQPRSSFTSITALGAVEPDPLCPRSSALGMLPLAVLRARAPSHRDRPQARQ